MLVNNVITHVPDTSQLIQIKQVAYFVRRCALLADASQIISPTVSIKLQLVFGGIRGHPFFLLAGSNTHATEKKRAMRQQTRMLNQK